jgi:hypothetical protein
MRRRCRCEDTDLDCGGSDRLAPRLHGTERAGTDEAAAESGVQEYRLVRRYLERCPKAQLILQQVDALIRELVQYRAHINYRTKQFRDSTRARAFPDLAVWLPISFQCFPDWFPVTRRRFHNYSPSGATDTNSEKVIFLK